VAIVSETLLLGFSLPLPFLRPGAPRTDPQAWQELPFAFEAREVVIRSDHPRCQEPNLDGLDVRGQRTLVVCNRGDRSLCLLDGPWLSNTAITQALTRQDRRELEALEQVCQIRLPTADRHSGHTPLWGVQPTTRVLATTLGYAVAACFASLLVSRQPAQPSPSLWWLCLFRRRWHSARSVPPTWRGWKPSGSMAA
jgi:hypothetical protein